MAKIHKVSLTKKERDELKTVVSKGKAAAQTINHARILLKADISESGKNVTDLEIADSLGISISQVERIRTLFATQGLDAAIYRRKLSRTKPRTFDGEDEARLITLACGKAPDGYARWSLRLIADKAVELAIVESISHDTVRRIFKKRNKTLA
jgi:transposase